MTSFSKNPLLFIFLVFSIMTLIVKELLYINKIQFFHCPFKKFDNLINLTLTEISNNIIKQYYGMTKTFKVLVIVKKK